MHSHDHFQRHSPACDAKLLTFRPISCQINQSSQISALHREDSTGVAFRFLRQRTSVRLNSDTSRYSCCLAQCTMSEHENPAYCLCGSQDDHAQTIMLHSIYLEDAPMSKHHDSCLSAVPTAWCLGTVPRQLLLVSGTTPKMPSTSSPNQ